MLWSKSKKLLILGKINSFYISNGAIRIKIGENSYPLSITHVDEFGKHYPIIVYSIVVFSYILCVSGNNHFQLFCEISTLFKGLFVLALNLHLIYAAKWFFDCIMWF